MAPIVIEHVMKLYQGKIPALFDINLEIANGEQVVVVGPSGCGKSTLLRLIAGLEELTSGNIYIGGKNITKLAPKDRDVAMVFQDYALYPHMTVRRNLAYALKLRRVPKGDIDVRVRKTAELLGLSPYLDRKPGTLSGGQKQRVALGRAIIREPEAFLMDEPLSNLDAKLRAQMRAEISRLHDRLHATTLYVTHDQAEAMTLADRIVAMKDGRVQQVASPDSMYDSPRNLFVAGFIGSPTMNLFPVRLDQRDGGYVLFWQGDQIPLPQITRFEKLARYVGRDVIVGIRPEHIEQAQGSGQGAFQAHVRVVENLGSERFIYFQKVDQGQPMPSDQSLSDEDLMVGRVSPQSMIRRGHTVNLVINAAQIHLFDPETEGAII
jgi:multiple sugar transport system ATP-binding protein